MKYTLFFIVLFFLFSVSCHSGNSLLQPMQPPAIAKDTIPSFTFVERLYLFGGILLQHNQYSIAINKKTGKYCLRFHFPRKDFFTNNPDMLRSQVYQYNPLIEDFVMGDSSDLFNRIEYYLDDPAPDQRGVFAHLFKLFYNASPSTPEQKLEYFSAATLTKNVHFCNNVTNTISFTFNMTIPHCDTLDRMLHPLATSYAQLLWAYHVFSANGPYNHLLFTMINVNDQNKDTILKYDYYPEDRDIKNMRSTFPPSIYQSIGYADTLKI